jgi:hypothetical protein
VDECKPLPRDSSAVPRRTREVLGCARPGWEPGLESGWETEGEGEPPVCEEKEPAAQGLTLVLLASLFSST